MQKQARLIISGLSGGSGKTMLSLGLARALTDQGERVKTFKKGPDYIDAAWLSLASGAPSGNLDPYFSSPPELLHLYQKGMSSYSFGLIEGNRGLFDGLDLAGSCSTAMLAALLQAPVLLVLDCTKMTRTAAAIIHGCCSFDPTITIGGVILNKIGTSRQEYLVRESIEKLANVPVLGCLPRQKTPFITERHMGLQGTDNLQQALDSLQSLAAFTRDHIDLTAVSSLAYTAQDLKKDSTTLPSLALSENKIPSAHLACKKEFTGPSEPKTPDPCLAPAPCKVKPVTGHHTRNKPVIGYVQDATLWFYYHENLMALQEAGANLVPLSLLTREKWPKIHGLYLGGGMPEMYAQELADNVEHRSLVASMAADGLPIYAECGGLMYLAQELVLKEKAYPMAGVFPYTIGFSSRPQGLGYVEASVIQENPYHPLGLTFRGHEFHFSYILPKQRENIKGVLRLTKGQGFHRTHDGALDGLLSNNTFASYMHIFSPAVSQWARNLVSLCF